MNKNLTLLLFFCLLAFSAQAGSYGFIYKGQTYYKIKDGVQLDESPFKNEGRAPASVGDEKEGLFLYFVEDEYARCYYWGDPKLNKHKTFARAQKESNIHCFKIKDLKEDL
ncbi:MAG: hypothetical protein CME62_05050 [Halobacteriovoraceae bacterium]|nr:hypothetical protein [Halobacteriovoraceae bacterium]|tara:strand:- start:4641 stop:4973 length:333 start_codon:yes stop_codon:yes gene_type:complete